MKISDLYQKLIEDAAGTGRIVPGVNTTRDVGPDHIQKQAAKWGFDVDVDGRPPSIIDFNRNLINNGKWRKSKNKKSSKSSKK